MGAPVGAPGAPTPFQKYQFVGAPKMSDHIFAFRIYYINQCIIHVHKVFKEGFFEVGVASMPSKGRPASGWAHEEHIKEIDISLDFG